jgi:hypothetical protein
MFKFLSKLTLVLVTMVLLNTCAAPPPSPSSSRISDAKLVGRLVTAKIDLPLRKGMVVYSNGEIDFAVYRTKLEALGSSIRRHERAQITKIKRKSDHIRVRLNKGGKGGHVNKKALRWIIPELMNSKGTTIHIIYDHSPTEQDLRPERIAHVLRDVLEIKGIRSTPATQPRPAVVEPPVSSGATLVSIEARPSRVISGQSLNLTVHFEVEGATTERPLSLTIIRQLYRGDNPLFSAPKTQQGYWAAGLHSSNFSLTVPPTTSPGVYRFKAWLSYGGKEDVREALFEVLERKG